MKLSLSTAALGLALALGFTAAPVAFQLSSDGIRVTEAQALARRGADDPAGHVRQGRGADDRPGDDRGGNRNGADDNGGNRGGNQGGDDHGGNRGGGHGSDD